MSEITERLPKCEKRELKKELNLRKVSRISFNSLNNEHWSNRSCSDTSLTLGRDSVMCTSQSGLTGAHVPI